MRIRLFWFVVLATLVLAAANPAPAATVTWVGGSGDWTNTANWSTGALPGPNDNVVISPAATITVTHSAGTHTVNSIQSSEVFLLSGGLLAVATTFLASNNITLSGGILQSATVITTNGASLFVNSGGGTLAGVTVNGTLDVGNTYNSAYVTVTGGLTLNGTALVGNPTNSNYGYLNFSGTQTLGGTGTVVFGDYYNPNYGYYFNSLRLVTGGTTLTIGPGITVHGQNGTIGYNAPLGGPANVSVVNQGTISSDNGGTFFIVAQPFTNQGLAQAVNGGTLTLNSTWSNSGTLVESGGTLNLGGSFSLAALGTLNRTNGTVNLTGTMANTGSTLTLNAASGPWVLNGGDIQGGTITASSVAPLIISSGTLDGVTVNGNWDVGSTVNGATLTVLDGLTNNGTLQVGNPTNSNYGYLNFSGTQTLGGTGTVVFGDYYNPNYGYYFNSLRLVTGGTTLTIGPGITVHGQNGTIGYNAPLGGPANVSVVNQGTISSDNGGTFFIVAQPFTNQGLAQAVNGGTLTLNSTWSNSGTLVESGGTLNLGGSFSLAALGTLNRTNGTVNLTGTMANTGSTLTLNAASGPWVLNGGDIQGGTITASSVAPLIISSGTLDGVTVNGNWDVGSTVNGATLTVLDGLTNNGTLQVGNPTNSNYGYLNFSGTQTLGGTGTVVFGDYYNPNYGYYFNSLRLVTGGTTLTIGPGITVHGQNGTIGYNAPLGGPANVSVVNQGTISSDNGGTFFIVAQPFTNQGLAQAVNGGTLTLNSTWSNSGTLVESGGTLNLGGSFSLAALGTLNRTNGTVNLTGTMANTGSTLTLNAASGPWVLNGGDIQGGTITASSVAPLIISSGTLDGVTVNGNWDVGSTVNGATLTVLDGLTNNGTLQVGNPTNSNYGYLNFSGTQTLGGTGTVVFGDYYNPNYGYYFNSLRLVTGGTTLTIGPGITVHGQNGTIGYNAPLGGPANVSVVNQGTISSDNGGTFYIYAQPFSNTGVLSAPTGILSLSGAYNLAGGTINVGINSLSSSGKVNFAGEVSLAGTLEITLTNGYQPALGNSFALINYGSEDGTFGNYNLPNSTPPLQVNYGNTSLSVAAVQQTVPIVNIINLTNNSLLQAPLNLPINATATSASGAITNVAFFAGTNLLGTASTAPYSLTWSNVPPGAYPLTATATDTTGATGISSIKEIVVLPSVPGTNFTWVGTVSSDWFTASNWVPTGVPGPWDQANILNSGTVSLSKNATIGLINLASGTVNGAGPLSVSNAFYWTGGSLYCPVTIQTNALMFMAGNSQLNLYGVLTNAGTVNLAGGASLYIVNYAGTYGYIGGVVNLAGAVFNLENDQSISGANSFGGVPYFNNGGLVEKWPTTGTNVISVQFNNTGTVSVESGTVLCNGGGTVAGNAIVAAGAQLNFGGGSFNGGSFSAVGPGPAELTGGTLTINGTVTVSNLVVAGGTLAGNPIIAGTMTWTAGSLGAGSTWTIATNGILNLAGSGTLYLYGVLTNAGMVNQAGGASMQIVNYAGTYGYIGGVVNLAGAVFNLENDQSISGANSFGGVPYFNNGGLVEKWPTTGTNVISVQFNNTGTVNVESGTVSLSSSYTLANGILNFGLNSPNNYGVVALSGSPAQLAGGISANLNGGFIPAISNAFSVLSYTSATGQCANVVLPVLSSGGTWQVAYTSHAGVLQVVSNSLSPFQIAGSVTNNLDIGVTNIGVYAYTTNSATNLFYSTFTDGNGNYALSVPNGKFQVGLEGLVNRGYNPVTNQTAIVSNVSVVVNFGLQPYTGPTYTVVTVVNPAGAGTVSGGGTFPADTLVTVTASPMGAPPYLFANWSQNGTVLTTNNSYDFAVNGNQTLVANYFWSTPIITNQPLSQTVVAGTVATLSVVAGGAWPLAYQWEYNGTNLADGGGITGSHSNVLTLTDALFSESGSYSVEVTNVYGAITSSVASLFVTNTSCDSPPSGIIAWWPGDGTANDIIGTNNGTLQNGATFTNGIDGQAFSFDGVDGDLLMPALAVSNLFAPTFTVEFWARAGTNAAVPTFGFLGSLTLNTYNPLASYDSYLTIGSGDGGYQLLSPLPSASPATWSHYAIVCNGTNYLVYFNSVVIDSALVTALPASSSSRQFVIGQSGFSSPYDDFFNGFIDEFSIYNRALSASEIAAIYDAGAAGKCKDGLAPGILAQPANEAVSLGGTASFGVLADGNGTLNYQWQYDGTNLVNGGAISGANAASLSISNVTFANAGGYSVMVNNSYSSITSVVATLTVLAIPPVITWTNPAPIIYGATLGASQLNASASVPGSFVYSPAPGTAPNAGSNLLSVVFTPNDTTNYATVTNIVGLIVQPAPLTVAANNASRTYGQANPVFTGTLTGVANGDNITAAYSCAAVSYSPPGQYPIVPSLIDPGNRLGNYTVTTNDGSLTVTPGAPPTLTGVNPNSAVTNAETSVTITGTGFELGAGVSIGGESASNIVVYGGTQITAITPVGSLGTTNVVVTNPDGASAALTNGFTYTGSPPIILTQPSNLLLVAGSSAVFSVGAQYAAGYQWQFDGGNLTDNGRITGSHGNMLTIPGVQTTDVGVYQVVVTNVWGSANSSAVSLSVIVAPTIGVSPQSQAVGIGGAASFTIGVNGTAPFTYQWLLGGVPLSGATNAALSISNVQVGNQGQQYSVVVSNAAGSATSAAATLSVLNYCASVQPSQAIYAMGSQVPLTVQTYNCSSQAAAPNSSATVWISTGGTIRSLPATTGPSGTSTVNFTPLATETGAYQVAAALPGQTIPAAQGTFTIVGMSLSRTSVAASLTPGIPVTNTVSLDNLTGVPLTGITASILGSTPDVQVTLNAPSTLAGYATNSLTFVMLAPADNAAQDQFYIQLTTDQGTTNSVLVTATVTPLEPQLVATPATLSAAMVGGGQTLVNFHVANNGGATSGPVQVLLPAAYPWLTTVTPLPIPPMAPGQSNQVTLALTPTNNTLLLAYPGTLELTSSNADLSVPFTFDCVSDLTGSLLVTVQDELSLETNGFNVTNATVSVTDFLTGSNVSSALTDASGTVLFTNLTSAYYTVAVSAPDHGDFNTTLLVAADQTNDLTAFINLNLVDYTWIVTPTTVLDHYLFTLVTTFETMVPWPVVTVSPGAIDLCTLQGQSTQVDLTITNSGLISAQGLNLYFGSHPDWVIQPLATSLGDLPPESSLVVPVSITQVGTNTDVPASIAAQLNYHVYTPTQTNETSVPIYVFDANPAECEPTIPTPLPTNSFCSSCGGGSSGSGGPTGANPTPPPGTTTSTGAVVIVKLQIDQSAVIARDAFHASLQLVDNAGATVSNLTATITVYDASNNVANSLFGIPAPTLNGINAVDGAGVLAEGATATVAWTIVPATNAAPATPTQFSVGGSFSYVLNGEPVTVPLFPVPITVQPTPIFTVNYFLQHDVYGDDPFTPQIEPSLPFALGIQVKNIGFGSAQDFQITSAQPQIIQNSNDLLIAFSLIGSQIGTNESLSPSFTLDFGALGSQSVGEGLWDMTCTLEGQFIGFTASYQHVDDFGNTNTSLIDSVNIHELNHVVRLTVPTDDGLPDFLVNDTTNVDALPDVVYSSAGTTDVVSSISITNTATIGSLTGSGGTITVLATNVPSGWVYLEIVDPGGDNYPIIAVQRSDGENLLVGPNVWQTPERIHMAPPKPDNLIHIFDYNSTGNYTVTYGLPLTAPTVNTAAATDVTPTNAVLNAVVTPNGANTQVHFEWGSTTNYGQTTVSTELNSSLYDAQSVELGVEGLPPNSTNHFQAVAVNSVGATLGGDTTFITPPLPPPSIAQVTNRAIADGQRLAITNRAVAVTPPITYSLGGGAPAGAAITTNGVFTWAPACEEGSSTNQITIWAADSSSPPLSNSITFTVIVGECIQVSVGSTVVQAGQTGAVTITLLSTVGLTNLDWTLFDSAGRLTNWTFAASNSAISSAQTSVGGPQNAAFELVTAPGQVLQSNSVLGAILFSATPGDSAYVPVLATNVQGRKADGSTDGNIASPPGRVVVVGPQPLLEALLNSNAVRQLNLYGNPGSNYEVMFTTNILSPNWQSLGSMAQTNLQEPMNPDQSSPQIFYRAVSQP